jgi:hypothetical protein
MLAIAFGHQSTLEKVRYLARQPASAKGLNPHSPPPPPSHPLLESQLSERNGAFICNASVSVEHLEGKLTNRVGANISQFLSKKCAMHPLFYLECP